MSPISSPARRYRAILGPEGDRAVPPGGPRQAVAKAAAAVLGRSRLFTGRFRAAFERLEADPSAPSLRLTFADAHFGQGLKLHVDPQRLDHYLPDVVTDEVGVLRLAHWFLDGSDWGGALRPLAGSEVDREVAALFEPAGDLPATPAYTALIARAAAGDPEYRNGVALDSRERIDAYFGQYRRLLDSIRQHGVTTRDRVPESAARVFAAGPVRGLGAERREREVGLAIDRSGALVRMVGGRHRTAIAQRLGLTRMPAQVRLVHVGWLRDRVVATGLPPEKALIAGIRDLAVADEPGGA